MAEISIVIPRFRQSSDPMADDAAKTYRHVQFAGVWKTTVLVIRHVTHDTGAISSPHRAWIKFTPAESHRRPLRIDPKRR
jgi:hypothetical protein